VVKDTQPGLTANPCGSEPARDSVVSYSIDVVDPPPSRAGSLPQRTRRLSVMCQL